MQVSKAHGLSLKEYMLQLQKHCILHHSDCHKCPRLLNAGGTILKEGFSTLSSVFRQSFPGVTYTSNNAKRCLLQLPLAAVRLNTPKSGKSEIYLMEYVEGVDYVKLGHFLQSSQNPITSNLGKCELHQLLSLAQSDRERELIRCTALWLFNYCSQKGIWHSGC